MLFPSRVRPKIWMTGTCTSSGPSFGSRRYEAVTIRTSYVAISHLRHDLHDVAVPERVVRADDHLRPGVDRSDEVLTHVRVDAEGKVFRRTSTRNKERVRQYMSLLIGPVRLVLDREDHEEVKELEDDMLDARLDPRRAERLQERGHAIQAFPLRVREFGGIPDSERRGPRDIIHEPRLGGATERELELRGGRDDLIPRQTAELLEVRRRREIHFVRRQKHGLPPPPKRVREAQEVSLLRGRGPRGQPGLPDRDDHLVLREPQTGDAFVHEAFDRHLLELGAPRVLLEVPLQDAEDPVREFLLEEANVLRGVVGPVLHGVALEVRPTARIHDVDERGRLSKVVEELVPEAAALV